MVALSIRFLVAVDQCVSLMRRHGTKLMIAILVIAFAESPELWRIAWTGAALVLAATFLGVMIGYEGEGRDKAL
jgi:hypothetical protein